MRALSEHIWRVQLMGIVNRTPDSFYDGGQYLGNEEARARVHRLIHDGANIIDVGAESTRPGSRAVDAEEQIRRIGSAVRHVVNAGAVASVDTTLADVAAYALDEGATIVNSVSLETAAELGAVAASYDADLVLTHCRGPMSHMSGFSEYAPEGYDNVVEDVLREWSRAAESAMNRGLARERLIFDPGLGFTKNTQQSLTLCRHLAELKRRLGVRVLVGPSRKSYIAMAVAERSGTAIAPATERLGGSIAATLDLVRRGADIVRIHDVAEIHQALNYLECVESDLRSSETPPERLDV